MKLDTHLAAKRLAVKENSVIRNGARSRGASECSKLFISVLLAEPGRLESVSAKPRAHAPLVPRRVFDGCQKAGAETLATIGFDDIDQFDE